MLELVSSETGKPLPETTAKEPRGFGLGTAAVYAPGLGRLWFYEGITLGYRAVYFDFPKDDLVVTAFANSQAPEGKDELPNLAIKLYELAKSSTCPRTWTTTPTGSSEFKEPAGAEQPVEFEAAMHAVRGHRPNAGPSTREEQCS